MTETILIAIPVTQEFEDSEEGPLTQYDIVVKVNPDMTIKELIAKPAPF